MSSDGQAIREQYVLVSKGAVRAAMEKKDTTIERKDVDNLYRRNTGRDSYRMRKFGNRASTIDEYSGERIFITVKRNGVAAHHVKDNMAEVDHITPIDTLIKENEQAIRDGYLTKEDLREVVNSDYNLAVTSRRINNAKRQKSNFEYLVYKMNQGEPENITTTVNMLTQQAQSRAASTTELAVYKTHGIASKSLGVTENGKHLSQNTKTAGKIAGSSVAAGTESGIVAGAVSGIRNALKVAHGDKSVKDAAQDTVQDSAASFGAGTAWAAMEQGKNIVARKASMHALEKFSLNQAAMAATTALTLVRCVSGEISEAEAAEDIAMTGIGLFAMKTIGTAVGGPAGMIAASLAVAAIEEAVFICKKNIADYQEDVNARKKYVSAFSRLAAEAETAIEEQRALLKEAFEAQRHDFDSVMETGFEQLLSAAMENDAEGIARGIDTLMRPFDSKSAFSSAEEFQSFIEQPDAVLVL